MLQRGQYIPRRLSSFLDTDVQIRNEKPNAERTQRLFASLRDELEKRSPNLNSSANSNSTVTVNGKGPADGHVGS